MVTLTAETVTSIVLTIAGLAPPVTWTALVVSALIASVSTVGIKADTLPSAVTPRAAAIFPFALFGSLSEPVCKHGVKPLTPIYNPLDNFVPVSSLVEINPS